MRAGVVYIYVFFVANSSQEASSWGEDSGSETATLFSSDRDEEDVAGKVAEAGIARAMPVRERAGVKATNAFWR